jgi:hypothetical protein
MDVSAYRRACAAALLVAAIGCHHADVEDRDRILSHADAARLVGAWNVTIVLERPLTILADTSAIRPVTGSIAFTENRQGDLEVESFGLVTHLGVSDLDLHSFSLPLGHDDRERLVIARTAPIVRVRGTGTSVAKDSVSILIQTADEQLNVILAGILTGDTVVGRWTAEHLRNEAAGRFVMSRRTSAR